MRREASGRLMGAGIGIIPHHLPRPGLNSSFPGQPSKSCVCTNVPYICGLCGLCGEIFGLYESGRLSWTLRQRVTVLIPRISEARLRFHRVAWRTCRI